MFFVLSSNNPNLQSLTLCNSAHFGNFNSDGLPYPQAGSLPNLTYLDLSDSKHLTTQSLIHICHTAPQLLHLKVSHCPQIQYSSKIGNIMATNFCYIEISEPPFVGFKPAANAETLYFRDAYFARVELEKASVALIMKNYKCWKRNVLWRWWMSAKKIKRAFRIYKFKSSCREYVTFTNKLKKRRLRSKKRRKEAFMRVFHKIRNSAILIQKTYRRYDACCLVNSLLDEIDASTCIQAAWRGISCRLQDHIWIMKKRVELKRLQDLIESGTFLPKPSEPFEIDENIRGGMPKLRKILDSEVSKEIKMTFNKDPQPRRFDEEPYVELPFSRKLPIFGGKKETAYEMNLNPDGVHVFGGNLWPSSQVNEAHNDMKDFFDPSKTHYQNYCEMLESKSDPDHDPYNPMPSHIPHPKCTLCSRRYMSLSCVQCCTSYCVQCSNHVHSKQAKKHHTIVQYRHEYIKFKREIGIVPHLNAAKLATQKLHALTDMAQNDAELKRIEESKELEKEMEEAEEEERLRAKEAAATEQRAHNAANVLQNFQRHALKKAETAALMLKLSQAVVTHDYVEKVREEMSVQIQKIFRGHSVRRYFYLNKVELKVYHEPEAVPEIKEIVAKRVVVDFDNRRQFERANQIVSLEKLKADVENMTKIESDWGNSTMEFYEKMLGRIKTNLNVVGKEESAMRAIVSKLDVTSLEYAERSVHMKVIGTKKVHNQALLDNIKLALRWLTVCLRQTTRRIVQSRVQSGWIAKHFNWIDEESKILKKLLDFVEEKEKLVDDSTENKYYKEWILDSKERLTKRLVAYDTEQESLLEKSLARLEEEKKNIDSDKQNVIEILNVLECHRQFNAEKVGSEIERMKCKPQSDESLLCLERASKLKMKQQKLIEIVLPKLSQALEHSHEVEDKKISDAVVFKNDMRGMSRHKMGRMQAVLRVQPKARRIIGEDKWMDMFRSQPWLTRQNAEEGRLEDIRKKVRKELNQRHSILEKQRKEVEKEKEEIAEKEKKILQHLERSESAEVESELERKDLKAAADALREEIDIDADTRRRRDEKLKESEEKLAAELEALDGDDKQAEERLLKQKDAIDKFRENELKGDEVILESMQREKKELEEREALLLKKEKIFQEEIEEGGGDVKKMAALEADREQFEKKKGALEEKERAFQGAMERREYYYKNAQAEAEEEMRNKKLKNLQEDIRQRKLNVIKAQRELEEQLAEEALAAQKEEEAKERANWQANQADEDIKSLGVRGMSSTGRSKINPVTQMKQFLRKKAGTRDDPEELQMVSTIKKRMKIKGGKVEALRQIKFTVGAEETDEFTAKQSKMQSEGMPFFRKIGREIGLHDQIVIWVEKTVDQDEFITDIELSHTNQDNEEYINLLDEGWERIGHPKMRGEDTNDPSFCIWMERNGDSLPIGDINMSYTLADEEELQREGFEMIESNMVLFGFGDMNMWVRKVERAAVPTFANSAHVAKELHECRKMLAKNPDDVNLKQVSSELPPHERACASFGYEDA